MSEADVMAGVPQRLKPQRVFQDLRRGLKPRPFKDRAGWSGKNPHFSQRTREVGHPILG
jgi:hypothetical protein